MECAEVPAGPSWASGQGQGIWPLGGIPPGLKACCGLPLASAPTPTLGASRWGRGASEPGGEEVGLSLIFLPVLADPPRVVSGTPAPQGDEYGHPVLFLVAGWGSENVVPDPLMLGRLLSCSSSPGDPRHVTSLFSRVFWLSLISCVYW